MRILRFPAIDRCGRAITTQYATRSVVLTWRTIYSFREAFLEVGFA